MNKPDRGELRWVVVWAVLIVLLSSLPYLWGTFITPQGYSFLWLTHNIDDGAVYLSWMRQAADGHFFIRNLFTNEPQPALQFNVLFLVMGWTAAITHLPLIVVFHLFRVVLGFALILGIWQFSKLFLDDPKQRRILIPLVGLSAGVGWMIPGANAPTGSVDVWQPEAITFLSIYLNPLFLAGLLLMLGAFYWLELARRDGKPKYALFAGLHLLVLGNVHTYDVLTVACVWTAYVGALALTHSRLKTEDFRLGRTVGLSLLAAAIAVPSVAYQFWVYAGDPIYAARANTPIPSPPILSYFAGYGLILVGVVIATILLVRRRNNQYSVLNNQCLLPVVWSIVGFAIPYIPIAQQRKLVMGLHIPLCILCAYAMVAVLKTFRGMNANETGFLSGVWSPKVVELRILLLSILFWTAVVISPIDFLLLDIELLNQGRTATHYSPYMSKSELSAMRYLQSHGKSSDVIYAPPHFSLFAPAMTGLTVHYGHWSETPDYSAKIARWSALADPSHSREAWSRLLASDTNASYYVSGSRATDPPSRYVPGLMEPCYRSGDVRICRVRQPRREG